LHTDQRIDISELSNLPQLFGENDRNIRDIETKYKVRIFLKNNFLHIEGEQRDVESAGHIINNLMTYLAAQKGNTIRDLDLLLESYEDAQKETPEPEQQEADSDFLSLITKQITLKTKKAPVKPRSVNQKLYIDRIAQKDLVFGIGPAGTGKTYLAVAMALKFLLDGLVKRIILTRPAVEAGERLGFLPGDLIEKINPYLRPLYDALYDMVHPDKVGRMIQRGIIEIAPLAYMRGRTLNSSFIILDEAQNTTSEQMKMFLTRLGFGSRMVITGDITQIDLPQGHTSGLIEIISILTDVHGIAFVHFNKKDVVRHNLVQHIIHAYELHGERNKE